MNYKNYTTINKTPAPDKKWCISVKMQKNLKQATVKLNSGRSYEYASRYPVCEGDIAIIGNKLPVETGVGVDCCKSTGQIGNVTEVLPKLAIKRDSAAELDMVFTDAVTKKQITDCLKYIDLAGDEITLQYEKSTETIYPITYLIRKLLAAVSIVSFAEFTTAEDIEKAKAHISRKPIIEDETWKTRMGAPEYTYIFLHDIHMDVNGANEQELIDADSKNYKRRDGYIDRFYTEIKSFLDGDGRPFDEYREVYDRYVTKYVYMGAISIIVRGNFVNLMEAFLSATPPIEEYRAEIIAAMEKIADNDALAVLKNYNC